MPSTITHGGRTVDHQPPAGGAPPRVPDDLPPLESDEGPMRRELRRQIARLERELTELVVLTSPWEPRRTSPGRGPAIQGGSDLEQIRDELLAAVDALRERIASGELFAAAEQQQIPAATAPEHGAAAPAPAHATPSASPRKRRLGWRSRLRGRRAGTAG